MHCTWDPQESQTTHSFFLKTFRQNDLPNVDCSVGLLFNNLHYSNCHIINRHSFHQKPTKSTMYTYTYVCIQVHVYKGQWFMLIPPAAKFSLFFFLSLDFIKSWRSSEFLFSIEYPVNEKTVKWESCFVLNQNNNILSTRDSFYI